MRGNLSVSVLGFASGLPPNLRESQIAGIRRNSAAVARELHFSKPLDDLICKSQLAGTARESVKGTDGHAHVDVRVIRSFALSLSGYMCIFLSA